MKKPAPKKAEYEEESQADTFAEDKEKNKETRKKERCKSSREDQKQVTIWKSSSKDLRLWYYYTTSEDLMVDYKGFIRTYCQKKWKNNRPVCTSYNTHLVGDWYWHEPIPQMS